MPWRKKLSFTEPMISPVFSITPTEPAPTRMAVRVKTSCWKSDRGMHTRKDVLFMRRLSLGDFWIEEDISNVGAEEVMDVLRISMMCLMAFTRSEHAMNLVIGKWDT